MRDIDEYLLRALSDGSAQRVIQALQRGANPGVRDNMGQTALHLACADASSESLISLLARAGARLEPNAAGDDPIAWCCLRSYWISACALASRPEIEVGAHHLAVRDRHGSHLGCAAAALGHLGTLRRLWSADRSMAEQCDAHGVDAFWHACECGNRLCAEFLAPLAPAEKRYIDGSTRMHMAARLGSADVVAMLASMGAPLGLFDFQGRSAMHLAAERGSPDTILALAQAGEPIDSLDEFGLDPLMVSIESRQEAARCVLLSLTECQQIREATEEGSSGESSGRRL